MDRLTTNKDVSEMGMFELAHNSCYAKDGKARYRDYDLDIDARDFIRKIAVKLNVFGDGCAELIDDESFDETLIDYLKYVSNTEEGLIAIFYRNLWAMADLRERLAEYEDLYSTESGYAEEDCIGEIVWDEEEVCFQVTERLSAESWEVLCECYVIGNIFDNPELLEDAG